MRIAVTGANGFLGRLACASLKRRGFEVRAVVRGSSAIPEADETVRADFHDPESLKRALDGCKAVVHNAGGGKSPFASEIYEANLGTTEALLQGIKNLNAGDSGLRAPSTFLLISSVAATGGKCHVPISQTLEVCSAISHYGKSKWQAEQMLLGSRLPIKKRILRLPALYGVGDERLFMILRGAVKGKIPVPHPEQRLSLLDASDAAEAVVAIIANDEKLPQPFVTYAEEGRNYTFMEISEAVRAELNPQATFLKPARWILKLVALAGEISARVMKKNPPLTLDKLSDLLVPSFVCDSAELRTRTGWKPQHQLRSRIRPIFESMPKI